MQRAWGSTAYWLVPHDFFCLLSYRTQGCLIMDVPTHKRLALATPITNFKKMPYDLKETLFFRGRVSL